MSSNPLTRCLGSLVLGATLSFMGLAACGGDESSGSCAGDQDCASGTVCQANACVAIECSGNGDCLNGSQACIDTATGSFCSAVECGCATCAQCPVGETCDNGTCAGASLECTPACTGTDVCDDGTCRACTGAECPTADCTVSGCTAPQTCNTTTKQCETPTVQAESCKTCANEDDCPGDAKCVPLASGNACLLPCDTNNDCETGFECGNHLCAPAEGRCEGCLVNGCGNNQSCNPTGSTCQQAVAHCGTCTDDWECGEGRACANGKCTDRCDGTTCAGGGNCVASNGVMVCENDCATACNPTCSGATPQCFSGTCVQCTNNGHCANGLTCNTSTHACEGTLNCGGSTPVEWQGQCVQCTSNQDCNGQFCNIGTHTCTSSQCASCADPYPSCVTIGNDSYCVQCDPAGTPEQVLELCGQGATCNDSTYACEGGTVTPTETCEQDADCVGGEAAGYELACDVQSGYCYDTAGGCDNITAYCVDKNHQPAECVNMFELFGGSGMQLPPEFSQGGGIPAFCECQCDLPGVCIGQGSCRDGFSCIDPFALLDPTLSHPFCYSGNGF